jgi:dipeptidyl aminopeptidase/acylaminoacyl peptidase
MPARGDAQAMAELGFVVVQLDAMGTPLRSKTFHAAYAADMGDNGIPDQVAAVRQLAARHRWVDTTRVGVWGHSGGGYATASAMLRFPEFFRVGVAEAGNHDNRLYEDDWGEKWTGLLTRNADGTSNYDAQANPLRAAPSGASCSWRTARATTTCRRTTRSPWWTRSSGPTATWTCSRCRTAGMASPTSRT